MKSSTFATLRCLLLLTGGLFWSVPSAAQRENVASDTWVCADELGRKLAIGTVQEPLPAVVSDPKIGMFYYLWHGQHGDDIKDLTRLLNEDAVHPRWGKEDQFHWSGQPALGFYEGGDPYIVSRHMQWLMDAGVDFYFFDLTNALLYLPQIRAVMHEIDRRGRLGLRTPKLAFTTHFAGARTVKNLYDQFYKDPANDKYWFYWKGKPLILVDTLEFRKLSSDIQERFTARHCWCWETGKDCWPWLAKTPQAPGFSIAPDGAIQLEQVSVAAAEHPVHKTGKSFHNGKQPPFDEKGLCKETPQGLYFDEQWASARQIGAPVVMVTQWNEWMAQRFVIKTDSQKNYVRPGGKPELGETYFIDVYNQEFSRDIEPSREPLIRDHYYLQLVSNVRRYRGARALPVASGQRTINLNKDFMQWALVGPTYRDEPGDAFYTSATAQPASTRQRKTNDIVEAKVSADHKNLYFFVETAEKFVPLSQNPDSVYWMTLLINSDCDYATGWAGYDWMVSNHQQQLTLYRWRNSRWKASQNVALRLDENRMMLKLPRKKMGIGSQFDFKWIDNVAKQDIDILDFYAQGDCAPDARFNYRYIDSNTHTNNSN